MIQPTRTYTRLHDAGVKLASSIYQRTPLIADTFLLDAVTWCCGERKDLNILEVGTCRGVSTAILAQRGRVLSLDVDARAGTGKAIKALDVGERVVRVVGPPSLVRPLVRGPFDLAFIDATHNYENVMRDFAFALLHTNCIIFHDYCGDRPGVIAAVDEIHRKQGGELMLFDCFAALRLTHV
mgnify:FL=1